MKEKRFCNQAPARDCSPGSATLATKIDPAADTKSAPNTEMIAAGKPKAQYVDDVLIRAKRRLAAPVRMVPKTGRLIIF